MTKKKPPPERWIVEVSHSKVSHKDRHGRISRRYFDSEADAMLAYARAIERRRTRNWIVRVFRADAMLAPA